MSRRPLKRAARDTTVRLNALNVRTLPPMGGVRVDYRDDPAAPGGIRGLILRVSPTGARSWAIKYARGKRRPTFTLGPLERLSLKEARDEAKKLFAKITMGHDPAEVKAQQRRAELTVGALVDKALAAKKTRGDGEPVPLVLRPSTRVQWLWIAKKLIKPALGKEPAATLKRQRIRAWGAKLAETSAHNAHAAFRVLRRIYSWAVENDKLEASPFVHLKAPGLDEIKNSDRVLSTDELCLLLAALERTPGQYADATLLLLLTMVRRAAVLGARRSEVQDLDGDAPVWIVPPERNKAGVQHLVPLVAVAAAIFRQAGQDILFPPARATKRKNATMQWSSRWIREQLRPKMGKLPRWTIHGFRRTAATHLREHLDADRDLVRLLLGHSAGPAALSRYDRAERLNERRRALESWAGFLASLTPSGAAETPSWGSPGAPEQPRRRVPRIDARKQRRAAPVVAESDSRNTSRRSA